MPQNEQRAMVEELLRRRDTLKPEQRLMVLELAKRMGISTDGPRPPAALLDPRGDVAQGQTGGSTDKRGWFDSLSDAVGAWWHEISPYEQLKGANEAVKHPIDAVTGMGMAQDTARLKSREAFRQGDYAGALRHALNYFVPLMGPGADEAGDMLERGEYAKGAGKALGMGTNIVLPGKLSNLKRIRVPGVRNPNAAEAAAAQFLEDQGVPVDAATKTGAPIIRGAQKFVDSTPIGAYVAGRAQKETAAALKATAERLAERVHPKATNPAQAGASLRGELEKRTVKLSDEADTSYGKFREIEELPANAVEVQVGTEIPEDLDALAHTQAGKPFAKLSPADQQVVQSIAQSVGIQAGPVPIMKSIAIPVDMRPVKEALRPIYQDMQMWMEPARRNASAGFQAMKSILEGDDFLPASVAEKGLGGLKTLAREGKYANAGGEAFKAATRDVNQGVGANATKLLQEQIDNAVARAPEGAGEALGQLRRGRLLTRGKYEVADLVKQLRDEPVQTFGEMTWAKDSNIEMIHRIQKQAPKEFAKIGRAWLEQLIERATAQGGWDHAQWMWSQWEGMGPLTKKALFKSPLMIDDLNKFFLAAKKMAENPNPSGTAVVSWIGAQGAYGLMNPATGVRWLLGTGAISKLLHSPKGVRLLTQGMGVSGKTAAGANIAAQILRIAGEESQRVPAQ
jgi:hypothetical protein